MSNETRETLLAAVAREIAEFQSAADVVDEAAAERLGIIRTDLRCLGLLMRGLVNAGQLADASGLSPGATTAALDRLERAGYARRVRDPADRRGVLAEATSEALQRIEELYGPIEQEGLERLARYSQAELALLRDFLREGRQLQIEQAARIRAEQGPSQTARRRAPRTARISIRNKGPHSEGMR